MKIDNLDNLSIELPEEFDGLPTFLVGGAVRDTIRGVTASDHDLMVAEVSPSEMRNRGFREIDSPNNDTFAVFQDSLDREVAIAREEVSTGDEHTDFDITPVSPQIPASEAVERDMQRRDFTINALAFDIRHDVFHDSVRGLRDLQNGVIRAVNSDSFKQDPLRILRACRFAARLDFEIEEVTESLMERSVDGLASLPQERVRMEMEKALVQSDEPSQFFRHLKKIGALKTTFPELAELTQVPAGPPELHQEGNAFEHTMLVLDEMAEIRPNNELAMLMALAHDLGKGTTDSDDLPSHPAHGKRGVPVVEAMAERLGMSNDQEKAMKDATRIHMRMLAWDDLRESTVIKTVEQADSVSLLWELALADCRGREPGREFDLKGASARFLCAIIARKLWTGERLIDEGYDPESMGGKNFGDLLHQKRVEAMRDFEEGMV